MKNAEIIITEMLPDHWNAVADIYKQGIATGMATFEKDIPSWDTWNANHIENCRSIALIENKIIGWAALSAVSSRCVYGGVAEVSVYVGAENRAKGIGELLLRNLIDQSEKAGYWTLQSGIFPENKKSIDLHQKAGFRIMGYREKIGQLDGVWKDNILMERRSKKVGLI
jgi:L-amino acid N-acyltransferase YncA